MKPTFKAVVAGLALAFVSTPLFAAPTNKIAEPSVTELRSIVVYPTVYSMQSQELLPCTATAEVTVFGVSMSFSVTADSCAAAARDLAKQISEMLQIPAGG